MGKIEAILKSEIGRLARREAKALMGKHVDELRRQRRRIAALEREIKVLKVAQAQERAKRKVTTAVETVGREKAPSVRLSPRLIRSLRSRLDISQAELAKLVGVSTLAVGNWELGKAKPRETWRFVRGFLRSPDTTPLDRAREAVNVSKSVRDKVLLQTKTHRFPRPGDRLKVGSVSIGQLIED